MTDQQIFDTSARGLILQGSKSVGNGEMFGHSFIDNSGKRCALGFLLTKTSSPLQFFDTYELPREVINTECPQQHYLPLPLELMRIHNCCEVADWPALLAACAKQFNLDDSVITEALARVAQRALGVPEPVAV